MLVPSQFQPRVVAPAAQPTEPEIPLCFDWNGTVSHTFNYRTASHRDGRKMQSHSDNATLAIELLGLVIFALMVAAGSHALIVL